MDKMLIEVALNENATKEINPNVPYGPEEIARDAIDCIRAGATIVHFHSRDPRTGEQRWGDAELYKAAMMPVYREFPDAILCPTNRAGTAKEIRQSHIWQLAEDPEVRADAATIDVGAANVATPGSSTGGDRVYGNSHATVIYMIRELSKRKIMFSLGARDISHVRHIRDYLAEGIVEAPLHIKLFMSDRDSQGPDLSARGLLMYLDMMPRNVDVHWFTILLSCGDGVSHMHLLAAAMGGHIRIGLGDTPVFCGSRDMTNAQQVEWAVDVAHKAGRKVATTAEARSMFHMRPHH